MPARATCSLSTSILGLLIFALLVRSECYDPDGSQIYNIFPCDTSATASGCCYLGDTCVLESVCNSTNPELGLYRAGCTDRTWNSPNCQKICTGEKAPSFFSRDLTDRC